MPFIYAFNLTFGVGLFLWLPFHREKQELKTRDGFLVVVLFWTVLSFFAALPLMMAQHPHLSFTNAMFESVSGFTTTGASVLEHRDNLPHDIRYYRQQLQFFGGMGIVVLAVAILPMLGVGGMQLFRAESPGPVKDSKLTPRITQTAKALWFLYLGLNLICGLAYWIAGMSPFDALGEAFGTVSTGGFSVHDDSFAYYNNDRIELIAIFFMILGGTNFSLHFLALRQRSLKCYLQDSEFKGYLLILFLAIAFTIFVLFLHQYFPLSKNIVKSTFNVVSMLTTTGFTSSAFDQWPTFIPVMMVLCGLIGGCAASTSGGMKVIRLLLLYKQTQREALRLIHPNIIIPIKFGKVILPEYVIQSMWGFISAYIGLYLILLLLLLATNLDLTTAFSALAAALANSGAALGKVASSFDPLSNEAKWILIVAMLAGRLEVFSLLVLFIPAFWER